MFSREVEVEIRRGSISIISRIMRGRIIIGWIFTCLIENISLGVRLVTYAKRTKTPPRKTRNRMYANQGELDINEMAIEVLVVLIINVIPIAMGCFKVEKRMELVIRIIKKVIDILISRGSLIKF